MEPITVTNIVYSEIAKGASCESVSRISFFGLLLIGLLVLFIIGLIILLASRKRPATPAPMPVVSAPVQTEDRQAILRKLADGELTKPEAEEQLNQLGTPVPAAMPAPPPATGSGKGCLIALLALIIPIILLLLLFAAFFGVRDKQHASQEEMLHRQIEHIEQIERMHETSQRTNLEHQ